MSPVHIGIFVRRHVVRGQCSKGIHAQVGKASAICVECTEDECTGQERCDRWTLSSWIDLFETYDAFSGVAPVKQGLGTKEESIEKIKSNTPLLQACPSSHDEYCDL